MNNKLTNIGDSLIVNVNPLIKGRVHFTGFTETFNGITPYRNVRKEYRLSTDEIFWTDWQPLTVENISQGEYTTDNSLFIQIRYTRIGSDATGEIEFVSIKFEGDREETEFVAPTLSRSIFGDLIGTSELQKTERNLFKKLYFRGIVPNYVTRGENRDYKEDKDYVDFTYSIARFFALILRFFKRFENFHNDEEMLREQLRGYGIYFNESNVTLKELQYIAENILSVIQQRGTEMIFVRKGDLLPNGKIAEIDGEAIRLIRSRECDELLYDSIPNYKFGWCLGNSSPMYTGTARAFNLNKTRENTQDFQKLNNFVLSKSGTGDYSIAKLLDNKSVLRLVIGEDDGISGIGRNTNDIETSEELIIADSKLDYEITFAVKVDTASEDAKIKFGVEGFDIQKRLLNDAFIPTDGSSVTGNFFELNCDKFIPGVWYNVRGILHAYSSQYFESKTNIGYGTDLIFNNFFTKYILPKIQISASGETSVDIWDYKIRPLVRGKNIMPLKDGSVDVRSLGFIESASMCYTYFRNNNNSQNIAEITDIIEKYLYPFNTINLFTILSNF